MPKLIQRLKQMPCLYQLRNLKRMVLAHYQSPNTAGIKLSGHYLVFESDDWGNVRVPNRQTYDYLMRQGITMDREAFVHYDCLESSEDLNRLFGVLQKYHDHLGHYPVFTANCVLKNPDFATICAHNVQEYADETFVDTYKKYPQRQDTFAIWCQGMQEGLWHPQLHGREHYQTANWLRVLQKDEHLQELCRLGMVNSYAERPNLFFMDAFSYNGSGATVILEKILAEACTLFQQFFGYVSTSFVACCYVWDKILEPLLLKNGIYTIQGGWLQFCPEQDQQAKHFTCIRHAMGEKNALGQVYLVRNCLFEPSEFFDGNREIALERCLFQIKDAFAHGKPAVISTHRENYIGTIFPENSAINLRLLDRLLQTVLHRWPDVEFITSDVLGGKLK